MAEQPKSKRPAVTAVQNLREMLLDQGKIIVAPGVYDGLTARIALHAGFDCLYMTGAGTSMSRLGMADLGVATLNDMRDHAAMLAGLDRSKPLIADADTGYGGPLMVGRTVEQYIAAGVAALHLEDQVISKRCGHLMNKEVVPEDEFLSRIRAAVHARSASSGDIVIIARTDALQALGYDAAVSRLEKAIKLGADVAFLEGIENEEQARSLCRQLAPAPVLLNMVEGGVTPHFSVARAKEAGFKMVVYPGFALGPVYRAVSSVAKELMELGDTGSAYTGTPGSGPKELFMVCGMKEAIEFDRAAGGKAYENGV